MDNQNEVTSQGKVSYNPGWNDPPPLAYTGQVVNAGKPRTLLNKRVPFPMQGGVTQSAHLVTNIPVMPSTQPQEINVASTTNHPQIASHDATEEPNIDSEEILRLVCQIFDDIISESTELGAKADNCRKKITIMKDMWSSGKLNKNVQIKVKDLATALQDQRADVADEIHKSLMVEHVSAVSSWMPAIRYLIHNTAARQELLAIDNDS